VFGIASVVGALAGPSEIILPGVVIGSVWAAVGFKRGLPLFASVSQNVSSPEDRNAQGLRTIRRRRRLAFIALVAWLPIAAIVLPRVSEKLVGTVFFLTALPLGALFAVWILSGCPRCERHFFPVLRPRLFVSLSRCDKCGLGDSRCVARAKSV